MSDQTTPWTAQQFKDCLPGLVGKPDHFILSGILIVEANPFGIFDMIRSYGKSDSLAKLIQIGFPVPGVADSVGVLRDALQKAVDDEQARYKADWDHADWFNNNMPNVGQSVEYMPLPRKKEWLDKAQEVLARFQAAKPVSA